MTCSCKKPLTERTVATKTRKLRGETLVEQTRQALVCDDCGVVAWDPPQPVTVLPYRPYVYPQPWVGPYVIPTVSPNTYPAYPQRYPNICGTAQASGQNQNALTVGRATA